MLRPLPIFSQSDYLIQVVDINSQTELQTVQIQISWLLQKSTDLDLHCLQRKGIFGFNRTRANTSVISPFYCWVPSERVPSTILESLGYNLDGDLTHNLLI